MLLLLSVAACQLREIASPPGPALDSPSLKSALPQLSDLAQDWDRDAYLVNASVSLIGMENWRITAGYQSPNRTEASLQLFLRSDGTVEFENIEHPLGVIQQEPIRDRDWTIDSPEAVARMMRAGRAGQDPSIQPAACSNVRLERFNLLPGNPVVWRLTLVDCSSLEVNYRYMDPITGEILALDRTLDATEEALLTPLP